MSAPFPPGIHYGMQRAILPLPPLEELHRLFHLDHETGVLTYRISPMGAVKAGDIAGRVGGSGYLDVCIKGRRYRAHRIIFKMANGRDPVGFVDHADADKSNNRPANLREASRSENQRNSGAYRNNQTGLKGVVYHKRDDIYEAWIRSDGKQHYLGRFDRADQAHAAYCAAAARLHGEFARTA